MEACSTVSNLPVLGSLRPPCGHLVTYTTSAGELTNRYSHSEERWLPCVGAASLPEAHNVNRLSALTNCQSLRVYTFQNYSKAILFVLQTIEKPVGQGSCEFVVVVCRKAIILTYCSILPLCGRSVPPEHNHFYRSFYNSRSLKSISISHWHALKQYLSIRYNSRRM